MKILFKVMLLLFLSFALTQCSDEEPEVEIVEMMEEMEEVITEEKVSFTKGDSADPTLESSQDRITDNVWITRGNNGGQIYNAKVEDNSSKNDSPTGTRWAIGRASDKDNLEFKTFRETIKPKEVVGAELVMHLVDDDIYINVDFSSWSDNGQSENAGGFTYERTKL